MVDRPRFNDSWLYHAWIAIRHPEHARQKRAELSFYRGYFGTKLGLVFDIGANGGSKSVVFASLADRVIAVEPSPAAASMLYRRFRHNDRVHIVQKGVGSSVSIAPFYVFEESDCYNTFSAKWVSELAVASSSHERPTKVVTRVVDIQVTTLDQLINEYGLPDYVKIDVEGSELQVAQGLSEDIRFLSFECNLPEFVNESIVLSRYLHDQNSTRKFNVVDSDPPAKFLFRFWITVDEIVAFLRATDRTYVEVYVSS
jgi:FkbM family methyltransferase